MGASVVWSETPDEDGPRGPADEPETPAEIDQSLPSRRLRHWLKAMFGGHPKTPGESPGEKREP